MPEFAQGNYGLGILNGLYEIRLAIEEDGMTATDGGDSDGGRGWALLDFLADNAWVLIGIGSFSLYAFGYMARTRSVWFGGIWGGAVGWLVGWAVVSVTAGFVGLSIGAFLGLVLDAVLSTAYRGQSGSGRSTSWHRTWGGFGGFNTGRSIGGGFGGFGGGRSGGGGASRKF
jgi:uncharacterized protein